MYVYLLYFMNLTYSTCLLYHTLSVCVSFIFDDFVAYTHFVPILGCTYCTHFSCLYYFLIINCHICVLCVHVYTLYTILECVQLPPFH